MATNDPRNPKLQLGIGGTVDAFATINPNRVVLFGPQGEPLAATVSIFPTARYPFRITGMTSPNEANVRCRLEEKKEADGFRYELHVENAKADAGRYYEIIRLKTDNAVRPEIEVTVYGNILPKTEKEGPKPQ